jgi:hypothetical protein
MLGDYGCLYGRNNFYSKVKPVLYWALGWRQLTHAECNMTKQRALIKLLCFWTLSIVLFLFKINIACLKWKQNMENVHKHNIFDNTSITLSQTFRSDVGYVLALRGNNWYLIMLYRSIPFLCNIVLHVSRYLSKAPLFTPRNISKLTHLFINCY